MAEELLVDSTNILRQFEALHPKLIDLSLDRVYRLAEDLGNPQNNLPSTIHIAGTNGKGSVLAFLGEMLRADGNRVHEFISPHLISFHERIRLSTKGKTRKISENQLIDILERAQKANENREITFFEITTLAAFLAFSETPSDYLVLETGLGGRLDATNIVQRPELCILTSISMDHANFLGDTVEKIAGEKAGILKPGVPCIVAPQKEEVLDVIEARAAELDCDLKIAGRDWDAFEQAGRLIFQDHNSLLDLPLPRLAGRHQIENAGSAIAAFTRLAHDKVDESSIARGLTQARWPARLQRLEEGALFDLVPDETEIWVDGGHNPAAAQTVSRYMAELEDRVSRPLHLIFAMMAGKDAAAYLNCFKGLAEFVATVTIPNQSGSYDAPSLKKTATACGLNSDAFTSLKEALSNCGKRNAHPPRILICGSLYFAGQVLELNDCAI